MLWKVRQWKFGRWKFRWKLRHKQWLWILRYTNGNRRVISIWRRVYSSNFSFIKSRQSISRFFKPWRRCQWLYFFQTKRSCICKICEVYPSSEESSKGAFLTRPCLNTSHPNHAFKKYEKSAKHKKLELKLSSNEASAHDHIIVGAEKINLLYRQKLLWEEKVAKVVRFSSQIQHKKLRILNVARNHFQKSCEH